MFRISFLGLKPQKYKALNLNPCTVKQKNFKFGTGTMGRSQPTACVAIWLACFFLVHFLPWYGVLPPSEDSVLLAD
jgi:hypothetical protein